MAMASAIMLLLPLLFTASTVPMALAMVASPRRNDCPPASHRRNRREQHPLWTSTCWYCPRAPCGWQLLFQLLLPWLMILTLCMSSAKASGYNTILTEMTFLPYQEEANMQIMGFCTESISLLQDRETENNEAHSIRLLLNVSDYLSFACGFNHVSQSPQLFILTSWNCVEKGRHSACAFDSSAEAPVQCSCIQAFSSSEWNRPTGEAEDMFFMYKEQSWTEISKRQMKMEVTKSNNPVGGLGLFREAYGLIESKYRFTSSCKEELCGRNPVPPTSVNPSVGSSSVPMEEHSKVNLWKWAGSEARTWFKAFQQCLCSNSHLQKCFNDLSPRCSEKSSINDIEALSLHEDGPHILSFNVLFGSSGSAKSKQFWTIEFLPSGLDMIIEGQNDCAINLEHRLLVYAFLTCPQVLNKSYEDYESFWCNKNKFIGSIERKGITDYGKCDLENSNLPFSCPFRGLTDSSHCKEILLDVSCKSSSFRRLRKLAGKVSLITALIILAMLTKTIKQDRHLAMGFRLWFSCSYTVFLQSVYSKSDALKAGEKENNQVKVLDFQNNQLSASKDEAYRQGFPVMVEKVASSLGYVFRRFLDSQDAMLNVRVQIAENCELKAGPVVSNHCDILIDNVMESISTPVEGMFSTISGDSSSNPSILACVEKLEEVNSFHLDPPIIVEDIVEKSLSIKTLDASEACESQAKEKKERRKRRKQRSNIIDLKRESERDSISGSSSPSSPASPATPLPCRGNSPFSQCNPSSNSGKTSTIHTTRGQDFRNSFARLRSNEPLSQLDVHGDHVYAPCNKDRIYHLHYLTPKANARHTSKVPQTLGTKAAGSGMVNKGNRNDKVGMTNTSENWAAVARRAAPKTETELIEKIPNTVKGVKSETPVVKKPMLLPSATFPQGGRSTQWRPQFLDGKFPVLEDPTSLSSSLVSTSLVAPDARAPGSRLAKNVDGNALDLRLKHRDTKNADVFLYDIWGDHFSEISRVSGDCSNNLDSLLLSSDGRALNIKPESFFASPNFMVHITGITESSPPSSFSIFSRDTIFSRTLPVEDTTCSFSPNEL